MDKHKMLFVIVIMAIVIMVIVLVGMYRRGREPFRLWDWARGSKGGVMLTGLKADMVKAAAQEAAGWGMDKLLVGATLYKVSASADPRVNTVFRMRTSSNGRIKVRVHQNGEIQWVNGTPAGWAKLVSARFFKDPTVGDQQTDRGYIILVDKAGAIFGKLAAGDKGGVRLIDLLDTDPRAVFVLAPIADPVATIVRR